MNESVVLVSSKYHHHHDHHHRCDEQIHLETKTPPQEENACTLWIDNFNASGNVYPFNRSEIGAEFILPPLYQRLEMTSRWIDRLKDIKGWKWRTRGKYEDVIKMTNTRMIKLIAVLTSTLTWSWSGLSFVLEPRGTWVLIRFLLFLYSCSFKCSVPTLRQWGIFALQNSFKV